MAALHWLPIEHDAQAPRLSFHPTHEGVIVKQTADGPDYIRFCMTHRWASPPMPSIACCPFCLCSADEADGRIRFDNLTRALVDGL